jgi:hypothetical protein
MKNMRAKDVQRFFERVATDWDTMRLAYYDERVIEKMAEISGVGEDSEVADVGTGTGFVAAGIAPRVKRYRTWTLWSVRPRGCPWRTGRWMPRSPIWSYTTPSTLPPCSERWPES